MRRRSQRQHYKLLRPVIIGLSVGVAEIVVFSLCMTLYFTNLLGPFFCPTALPPLFVSGARHLTVPAACYIDIRNHCPGIIDAILPYEAAPQGAHTNTVLFSQDGVFYTVGDGSAHKLNLPYACAGVMALTTDGQSLACVAHTFGCVDCFTACTSCYGDSIVLAPLTPALLGRSHTLVPAQPNVDPELEPNVQYSVLSWSPDDHYLAVDYRMRSPKAVSCSLAMYSTTEPLSAMSEPMTLTGLITFSDNSLCNLDQLVWSPDGSQIALLQNGYGDTGSLFVLPTNRLPATIFAVHSPSAGPTQVTMQLNPYRLLTLPGTADTGEYDPYHALPFIAWEPTGHLLTLSDAYGFRLIVIDTITKQARSLLTLPNTASVSSPIQKFGWLPDGVHLVFAIGHGGTDLCGGPPDALYLIALPSPFRSLPRVTPAAPSPTATPPVIPTETPQRAPTPARANRAAIDSS